MLLLYVMMASVILKAVTKDILKKLLARIEGKHLETFCDDIFESEKEMKVHLKNHVCKEAVFKCEDCDFFSEN